MASNPPGRHRASPALSPAFTPETGNRLERALSRAALRRDVTMRELRDAICTAVGEMRARGVPPEQMLSAVKALVRKAVQSQPAPGRSSVELLSHILMPDIVSWCVEEYYREE